MNGDFTLNKPGFYKVLNALENTFLNDKLESDQYGIYYSVRFEGDAETFLWQAKTAPVEGEKYYGHIEQSKSGKSLRFKKDKQEEQPLNIPKGDKPYLKDVTDLPARFFQSFIGYFDVQSLVPGSDQYEALKGLVELVTDDTIQMIDKLRNGEKLIGEAPVRPTVKSPLQRGMDKQQAAKPVKELWPDAETEDEDV